MKISLSAIACCLLPVALFNNCGISKKDKMTNDLKEFIKTYEAKVIPLAKDASLASWNAAISGKDDDYKKASDLQVELTKIYSNKADFARLKSIKESGLIDDAILKRELAVLYNMYQSNQIDIKKLEALIKLQTQIEQKFNLFRAEVNGKKITDNQVEEILKTSINNDELKAAWLATKKSGPNVADDVKQLVKMRNDAAKELGFKNFHEMSLLTDDQKPEEIEAIFNELDSLTKDAYAKQKDEIDTYLAKRYKIDKKDLMPWHYQNRFFQEAPKIYKVDLDAYYKNQDEVALMEKYYTGIDMNVVDLVAKSDLFEKPGKNQHGFCTDIDKDGDIRVLCNVKPNLNWMNTLLHEFGHAAYDKYIDRTLPYTLRDPAHTFTTEAIAMLFGRFSSNAQWMKDMNLINNADMAKISDDCFKSLRLDQLVFSRWAQVMYHFEKSMYANPEQDLNNLWWDLVEKYQLIKRPPDRYNSDSDSHTSNLKPQAPADWASKIHIATVPCYYHNYLLGEMLASQLYYYIVKNVIKSDDYRNQSFDNKKEAGDYLIEKVFKPGKKWYWNDMIQNATGEKLTAKYYSKQFVY